MGPIDDSKARPCECASQPLSQNVRQPWAFYPTEEAPFSFSIDVAVAGSWRKSLLHCLRCAWNLDAKKTGTGCPLQLDE